MPINVLEKNVAELIAAGEVIERPSSVMKELIENSIDAGAKQITVEISGGGVTFMRITDDGSGIEHYEVPVAFLRHATSKVSCESDLESIVTMGFRGEALASISAVAVVEMLTKKPENETGTSYKISGGETLAHMKINCPDGTTIVIRDLFYNTPARLKFLKKDVSEGNAVQSVVEKLALINPNISFRFIRENKPILTTPGDGKLISGIYSVFGKQFACSLIAVDYEQTGISVKGYISSPLFCRGNRTMQYFFVNTRYVKSAQCVAALEEGYRNSIMTGKFPAAVLNITINPANVDVNVHPSKTEVRFTDDKSVFNAIYFAVKNAVLNSDNVKEIKLDGEKQQSQQKKPIRETEHKNEFTTVFTEYTERSTIGAISPFNSENRTVFKQRAVIDEDFSEKGGQSFKYISEKTLTEAGPKEKYSIEPPKAVFEATEIVQREQASPLKVIGELWSVYIICEENCGEKQLVLIDKHAAHERLRFEKLRQEFINSSQLLTESRFVSVDSASCGLIEENKDLLLDLGIEALRSGNNTLEITAMPSALVDGDTEGIITEICKVLENGGNSPKDALFGDLLHGIACKSAIKANDKSDITDLEMLANAVYTNKSIRFCPHGRPIIITLSKREIEKYFGRV